MSFRRLQQSDGKRPQIFEGGFQNDCGELFPSSSKFRIKSSQSSCAFPSIGRFELLSFIKRKKGPLSYSNGGCDPLYWQSFRRQRPVLTDRLI